MNLRITIIGEGRNSTKVLGDDAQGWKVVVDPGMPRARRNPRVHPLFRARVPAIYGGFNSVVEYGFSVDRVFPTVPEAMKHKHFHPGDVPTIGRLLVESNGFKAELVGCAITPVCTSFDLLSVVFHYECIGQEWI